MIAGGNFWKYDCDSFAAKQDVIYIHVIREYRLFYSLIHDVYKCSVPSVLYRVYLLLDFRFNIFQPFPLAMTKDENLLPRAVTSRPVVNNNKALAVRTVTIPQRPW